LAGSQLAILEGRIMRTAKTSLVGGLLAVALILAACSSSAAGGAPTITTATVGSNGTLVVAGSNSMTLYTFSKDTANSGTSACTGDCLATWPPLTVAPGTTPTAGGGANGAIGTITRTDANGVLQATYNGLPLYFFSGDSAVGDSNGIYTNWTAVRP
jgi:predicted lipoprotein with Yx(FWY)xxD motif